MTDQFQGRPWTPTAPAGGPNPTSGHPSGPLPTPPPGPPPRRTSPWVWVGVAVAVLVLLGGVITAGAVAGMSGRAPSPTPSTPVASQTTSPAPYTVFPTQPTAPSASGWNVNTMFGAYNSNCRPLTPITGEVEAIACDTAANIYTAFAQYSGTYAQYLSTVRSGFDTFTFIAEDSCSADYKAMFTDKDGVQYQHYVRIYKNSPFTWSEASPVGKATWQQMIDAPVPTVGNPSVLCGT